MLQDRPLKERLLEQIAQLPEDRLRELDLWLNAGQDSSKHDRIMRFAGIWKDDLSEEDLAELDALQADRRRRGSRRERFNV